MQSKTLAKADWQSGLDRISKAEADVFVSIIVSGQDIGVQTEADQVPFLGISYDPHGEMVSIETDDLDHRISKPSQIVLAHDSEALSSIEIVAEDVHHIVSFEPVLPVPDLEQM